jgi:hypothetical protein
MDLLSNVARSSIPGVRRLQRSASLATLVATALLMLSDATWASLMPNRAASNSTSNNVVYDPIDGPERQEFYKYRTSLKSKADPGDTELGGDNESTVTIDPTNPANVAYASLWELRVSTDSGWTFGPPVASVMPPTHYAAGDPSIAFDSSGRLFWSYLGMRIDGGGTDIFIAQCDPTTGVVMPGYPVNVSAQAGRTGCTDKEWLAADCWPGSPYADRLYIAWTNLNNCNLVLDDQLVTYSSDHGLTWAPMRNLTTAQSGWPVHAAVAANGDVYVAFHGCIEWYHEETTGYVGMFRSADGGNTFAPTAYPFPPGTSGITRNQSPDIAGTRFWLQGSLQPWILPDPNDPASISVVSCDDPDNNFIGGDASNVYIARSTDFGVTWGSPVRIDSGPAGSFQVMPTASIDRSNGNLAVTWYDNRSGARNSSNRFLLDVYAAVSRDGGLTFGTDFQVSARPFDPDPNAPCRFNCPAALYGVWMGGVDNVYVCGTSVYHWDGAVWTQVSPGGASANRGVWGLSANSVWLAGLGGQILFFDGSQWMQQASGVTANLWRIHGRAVDDVFITADGGTILHWDGSIWTPQQTGVTDNLRGIWTLPGGTAWAVGWNGAVVHHDGTSWRAGPSIGTTQLLMDVWCSSDNDVWVVGYNGGLFHWDGAAWTELDSHTAGLNAVWGSAADNVYFTGVTNALLHWNGSSLDLVPVPGDNLRDIAGSGPDNICAAGYNSTVTRFDGAVWRSQLLPGVSTNFITRIGEYNGVAVTGISAMATWTGNTTNPVASPAAQQTVFDRFPLNGATPVDDSAVVSIQLLEPGNPNPFSWVTNFSYSLRRSGRVQVAVFDVRGRLVRTIESAEKKAGRHAITWNGQDESGANVAAGTYLVRVESGDGISTRKILLEK